MKAIALVNPAAGGVTADGARRMQAALENADIHGADVVEVDLSDCDGQMERIAASEPDLFIVWGGDGTLRSALTRVGKNTPNLLLLPGGTMNLLTKSIHGNAGWEEILGKVLASPKHHRISAGRVNGQDFYCAMLAGAPARFAEARESLRRGQIGRAMSETREALDTLQGLHLDASYKDGYSFVDGHLPTTSVIGALVGPLARNGGMEIAALAEPTTGAALNMVWASFTSDWRNAPGVRVVPAETLVIECEEDVDIPIILDGEATEGGDIVRVAYIKEAAQCLTAA
jgi:diacylglycerol kinase family enzyme